MLRSFFILVLCSINAITLSSSSEPIHSISTEDDDIAAILLSLNTHPKKRREHPGNFQEEQHQAPIKRARLEEAAESGIKEEYLPAWNDQPKTIETLNTIAEHLEKSLRRTVPELSDEKIAELQKELQDNALYKIENNRYRFLKKGITRQIPIPENAHLYIVGDLHGDYGPIDALLNLLEKKEVFNRDTYTITDPLIYVAFLGDYIDRGPDSIKVLWELTRLHEQNPNKVLLVHGNHETEIHQLDQIIDDEITEESVFFPLYDAFSLLPMIYKIDFIEKTTGAVTESIGLVHGGINPDETAPIFNPQNSGKTVTSIIEHGAHNYLWNDMRLDQKKKNKPKKRLMLSKKNVVAWMEKNQIHCLFRGHQQANKDYHESNSKYSYPIFSEGPTIGIASRWDDLVITLNVAPNTGVYNEDFGGSFYDATGTFICLKPSKTETSPQDEPQPKSATRKLKSLLKHSIKPYYFDPDDAHHKAIDRSLVPQLTAIDYSSSSSYDTEDKTE